MSKKIKTYSVINDQDGNDSFQVIGANAEEAAKVALEDLGWWIAEGDEIDVDDKDNCIYCGQKCYEGEMCDEQQAGGFNKNPK